MEHSRKETVLVTGGSGFVGSYCILQLLQKGYNVKTTIRSLSSIDKVKELLKAGGIPSFDNLTFFEADLSCDTGWDEAVSECDYVLHVVSPFPSAQPKDENELVIPAREGALRVLRAARDAGVKRVVLTSSFAAIGYSIEAINHVFTEKDWTDPRVKLQPYIKSKVVAERTAWDFIETEGGGLELTVINPVGIFGPVLGDDFSSSINFIKQMLSGKMPGMPKLSFNVLDVRDVADIHVRAILNPETNGQRFLASSDDSSSLTEIARLLKANKRLPVEKLPTKVLPNWLVKVAAWFKPELRPLVPQLGILKVTSNQKAKTVLDWKPRTKENTIIDTAESLVAYFIY